MLAPHPLPVAEHLRQVARRLAETAEAAQAAGQDEIVSSCRVAARQLGQLATTLATLPSPRHGGA